MSLILSGTDGLSDVDGSASTPAIRGTDTNTGIFFPAADTIAFTEGGVESMRIDSSGNVGIGTSSPFVKLQVTGTIKVATGNAQGILSLGDGAGATTNCGVWRGSANAPTTDGNFLNFGGYDGLVFATGNAAIGSQTERMRIDSSGNVGIGTSSPQAKLHVSGTTTRPIIQATNTAGNADIKYQSTNRTYVVGVNTGGAAGEFAFYDDTAGAERMRINSSGDFMVGKSSAGSVTQNGFEAGVSGYGIFCRDNSSGFPLYITNNSSAGGSLGLVEFRKQSTVVGSITTNGTSTTYGTSSDYRLKENVTPMTGALQTVCQLKPVTYNWKIDGSAGQGFIAHELQQVIPDCVVGEKDAVNEDGSIKAQSIDTSFLVATLTAAIQEQQAMIEELKAEVAALKAA